MLDNEIKTNGGQIKGKNRTTIRIKKISKLNKKK